MPFADFSINAIFRVIVGTDPVAGAEVVEVVPVGKVWQLLSLSVFFQASAVAASRRPSLVFDDGTNIFARSPSPNTINASGTHNYSWGVGAGRASDGAGNTEDDPIVNTPLSPGFRIRTVTLGLDVGDNYGPPTYFVAEYASPPEV